MEMGGGGGIRIAKRGNTKLAAGIFVVKGFPFVTKEFREDANANQKLCIALNNSEQIALHPARLRRSERRSAMNLVLPNPGEGL